MTHLSSLSPLCKKRKRIGRGGSRGGTSTRGHQGQGSRTSGTVGISFEGGQMPLVRRLPKRGFNNAQFETVYEIVNVGQLEAIFDAGTEVTLEALKKHGLVSLKKHSGVKLLGSGALSKKLTVHVHACSASAREALKKHGGDVHIVAER